MGRPALIPLHKGDVMRFSELARECLLHLEKNRGYSGRTTETYGAVYSQFRGFLENRTPKLDDDVRHFNPETCFEYMEKLRDQGAAPNTVIGRLSALSTLARYGMKRPGPTGRRTDFVMTSDPTKTFDWPRAPRQETPFLHPAELEAFLNVPVLPEEAVMRDLLVETGIRVSEACRASVKDLRERPDGSRYLHLRVKSRGERHEDFELSPMLAKSITERLIDSGRMTNPDAPLLVNQRDQRWERTALSMLMARIGRRGGLTRLRTSAHKLRHTANVVARISGLEALTRSRLLGHSNPTSIARYEHLLSSELTQAREKTMEGLNKYLNLGKTGGENTENQRL